MNSWDGQLVDFERALQRAWRNGHADVAVHARHGVTELQRQAQRRVRVRRWILWGKHAALLVAAAALIWAGLVLGIGYGPQ
jgi:beta-phosphoglucomutase-like phosphatase (HAD superfamily)